MTLKIKSQGKIRKSSIMPRWFAVDGHGQAYLIRSTDDDKLGFVRRVTFSSPPPSIHCPEERYNRFEHFTAAITIYNRKPQTQSGARRERPLVDEDMLFRTNCVKLFFSFSKKRLKNSFQNHEKYNKEIYLRILTIA